MTIIKDWEQVPRFTEDREEAGFWEEARGDVRLMEASVVAGNTANESVTITLRMDPRMLARVKRIARRGLPVSTVPGTHMFPMEHPEETRSAILVAWQQFQTAPS